MATIVLRSVKGTPLTNNEVDANFNNLNTAKLETITSADGTVAIKQTGTTIDISAQAEADASIAYAIALG
jgi:hypothetical protein